MPTPPQPGAPPRPSMPSPLPPSLWSETTRRVAAAIALLVVAGLGFGLGYLLFDGSDEASEAPGPTSVQIEADDLRSAVETGGFPQIATRNTTRVGGIDAVANAASIALATYPTQGGFGSTEAVTIAPAESWQLALAATPLAAAEIGTPILLSGADEVPAPTSGAVSALAPEGLEGPRGTQAFVIGDVAVPDGLDSTEELTPTDPAKIADLVDQRRAEITGVEDPPHLLVVSSADAGLAMPGAAWAARSGDPLLFADGDEVPAGTLKVIERHPDTPVYVLGPESAISAKALKEMGGATRIGTEDPVENAIEFARFIDGTFGWNINDPGHGFAIANIDRPLDAAAAAPLASTGGSPGPLLLTDDPGTMPPALQGFLSDTQPGFEDDPTRAVFNHVWIIGDPEAISIPFQAQVDQLTKLAPVSAGEVPPDVVLPESDEESTVEPPTADPGVGPEVDPNIDPRALEGIGVTP